MSSQQISEKSSSNANSNGAGQLPDSTSDTLASTVSQVAFLQQVISSSVPTEEGAEGDISEILKQLEAADGVAQGVESKLDKLLENLEEMIEGLEGAQDGQSKDRTGEKGRDSQAAGESGHA